MHLGADAVRGGELFLGRLVLHHLDRAHQPLAAHVADVGMPGQRRLQAAQQMRALGRRLRRKILTPDDVDGAQRHRAAYRVGAVGIGVHPRRRSRVERLGDAVVHADPAEREVAGGHRLGEQHQVRLHAPVVEREQLAGAAESGNHFVGHQQHVVAVADFADARKVVVLRRDHSAGALHRLRQEHGHAVGPLPLDGALQLVGRGHPLAHPRRCLVPVRVGRRDVQKPGHARLEGGPVGGDAGRAHRRQGHPVVAPLARNHLGLARLAAQLPIGARQLEGGLARLAAAGGKEEAVDGGVGQPCQPFGQPDGAGAGAAGVGGAVGQRAHLLRRGLRQLAAAVAGDHVPQARQAVQILLAVGVHQHRAAALHPYVAGAGRAKGMKRVNQMAPVALQ